MKVTVIWPARGNRKDELAIPEVFMPTVGQRLRVTGIDVVVLRRTLVVDWTETSVELEVGQEGSP